MGQYTVIIVLSAILLGGVILFNARSSTSAASTELTAYQSDRIAREASQVALRDVVRELNARPEAWTSTLSAAQAEFDIPATTYALADDIETTYSVTLTEMYLGTPTNPADPDRVRLRVDGTFDSWSETTQSVEPTDYVVEAVYERGWVDVNVPGGFRDAIMSDQLVDVRGNIQISGDIHSNDEISSSGGSFDVFGTGTYTGSESANDAQFTGGVAERDSIVIPDVTIPPSSSDKSFAANHTLTDANDPAGTLPAGWYGVTGKGTEADPYILYVNGDLGISGDVRLLGHIRIYVNGEVTINGNSSLSSVTAPTPDPNQDVSVAEAWAEANLPEGITIGIYANGDVTMSGTMFIAATVYTYGAVRYTGGGHKMMVGGIIAHEPLDVRGNAKVYYKEGADSVYDPGIPRQVPDGIRLVAYREWAERP